MIRTIHISAWFLLLAASSVFGQSSDIRFDRLSLNEGLSQSSVFSIVQDRQGFMWFGTQDGLNKYDGYQFTVYRRDALDTTSLSDNYVSVLFLDSQGTLWIGTRGGGLNHFDYATTRFTRYRHRQGDTASLSDDQVTSLCEDHHGNLWVGTMRGLNKMDRASGRFTRFLHDPSDRESLPNNYVQSLFSASSGMIRIGMIDAAAVIDPQTGRLESIPSTPPFTLYNGFLEDRHGTTWALTSSGLATLDRDRQVFRLVPSVRSVSLHAALMNNDDGNLWIGTDHGLLMVGPAGNVIRRYVHESSDPSSLGGDYVLSVFRDAGGVYWIGTYEGISKYSPRKTRFKHVALNPAQEQNTGWNKVRGFTEDATGTIWMATQEGLMKYSPSTGLLAKFPLNFPYPRGLGTSLLWSVLSNRGFLWIGTNGRGLVHLSFPSSNHVPTYKVFRSSRSDQHSLSGDAVLAMAASHDGSLWIGTLFEGLDWFNPASGTFVRYRYDQSDSATVSHDEVWALLEDRHGTLWAGTAGGGLNSLAPGSNAFRRYTNDPSNPNSLTDNKVTALCESRDGTLWVGTYAGLNRLDRTTGNFTHFTMKDGLPNDVIYGILEDDRGNLWISTNKGLSRFIVDTNAFRNFDVGDGLQSNEFNQGASLRLRNGEMMFGGINGFNIFNPDSVFDNPVVPQVAITDVRVFNQSLLPGPGESRIGSHISNADTLFLSYRDNVFSFSFAALEYTNPAKNQYAYRMVGFDDDWRYVGPKREATYTNLVPSSYVFRVRASNNDGLWNEAGASLVVLVAPPFWMTWWSRTVMVALFLGIGPLIYFRRVNRLQKERRVQERFSRQLLEEQERERQRIAGELHDSLGQDLLVIKNRASLGIRASGRTRKAKEQFEEISGIVSRTLRDVRRLSHNLRPYQLDRLGLSDALRSVLQNVESSSEIRFTTRIDSVDHLLPAEAEINVFRIVQEGVNNILKHSDSTEAAVNVTHTDGLMTIRIRDNGKGFPAEHVASPATPTFGLTGIQQRVRLLGGSCSIVSAPGVGTRIDITISIQPDKK